MNLRTIALTVLALGATACGSTTSNPQPYRPPAPVQQPQRPQQPVRQQQPVSQVPNYQPQPPVYHEHAPVRGGDAGRSHVSLREEALRRGVPTNACGASPRVSGRASWSNGQLLQQQERVLRTLRTVSVTTLAPQSSRPRDPASVDSLL